MAVKYKLLIAYCGTQYVGWQAQPGLPSVAQTITGVFERLFSMSATILAASRTDAGVHALGQIALLKTQLNIDPAILLMVLNNSLPSDIVIRSAQVADGSFHPWYKVEQKTYYYHFFTQHPLPFIAPYGWHYRLPVDYDKLHQALQQFAGTHNFTSFACAQDERTDMIRTVNSLQLSYLRRFKTYRIQVMGQKFLRHMIRRIVGGALYVASHKNVSIELISDIITKQDPHHILPNAPAQGLLLRRIKYNQ